MNEDDTLLQDLLTAIETLKAEKAELALKVIDLEDAIVRICENSAKFQENCSCNTIKQ